jgi:hypothetical protein
MGLVAKIQEFNNLIDRKNKGEKFLDDLNVPLEEKEKHIDLFKDLLDEINKTEIELNELDFKTTENDYLHGIAASSC